MTTPTLKLTQPNGGELFIAGCDTAITWTGVAPSDTVWLEYSINRGTTWSRITRQASGLKYVWKNVPTLPSGQCLVRIHQGGNSVLNGDDVLTLTGHSMQIFGVAFSPDGNQIVTGSADNTAKIWDANTGKIIRTLTGHTQDIRGIAFSPDGSRIATGSEDNTTLIWDANTGTIIRTFSGSRDEFGIAYDIYGVAFSPDGNQIVIGSADHTAKIWDVNTGVLLRTLTGHTGYIMDVAYSADQNRIVTGSWDQTANIWDANTGALLQKLNKNSADGIYGVAFSPDGRRIATASTENAATIWDSYSGSIIRKLEGHTYGLFAIAFSPDGSKIATASGDRTAKIWDANTGAILQTYRGHTEAVYGVAFSPDGCRIATVSVDRTTKIWDVDVASLQEDVSDAVFSIVAPMPSSQDVDMKQCLVGSVRDSLVSTFVQNKGSYPFRMDSIHITGADASQFSLVSGIPPFNSSANTSHAVEFRFKPTSVGIKTAELVVYTQSDTLRQLIRGEGVAPALKVVTSLIDFGKVLINSSKDTLQVVTIKNMSTSPLKITNTRHAGPNNVDFTTLKGGGEFTVAGGDSATMNVRFLPTNIGRTSGRLLFEYNGVGSPAVIQLFGEGIQSTGIHELEDLEKTTGTVIHQASLSIQPNPTQNTVQIQYVLSKPQTATLELLNITGQVVQTIFRDQQKMEGQYLLTNDLSTIGNGVYILRLTTNRGVLTTRVDVVK